MKSSKNLVMRSKGDHRDVFSFAYFFHFAKQEVVFLGLTQKIVILGG